MGAVWLAHDQVLGRAVALKRVGLMPGTQSTGPDLNRAEREAKLAARLNHPHVVAVFDLVTQGDEQWLVMEYVEGVTLAGLVQRDGPLSPDRAAPLIRQAAEALTAAHGAGIVHRDVKPSNIMVTPQQQVKLADFGIARAEADATLTVTGLVTGSPAYLAPEVASGATATEASDVWSLGATLFHALAGRPPYQVGDNVMGALFKIVHEDPPRLSDAGWLTPLLESTMTKDPAARWNMGQVEEHLSRGPAAPADPSATAVLPSVSAPDEMRRSPAEQAEHPVPAESAGQPGRRAVPATVAAGLDQLRPVARSGSQRARRNRWMPLAGVLAAVLLVVVTAALLLPAITGDPTAEPTGGGPSGASTSRSTDGTASADPTTSVGAQRAAMISFVDDYLTQVTEDPSVTWQMLTPGFQQESGGFANYRRTWLGREIEDYGPVTADPQRLVVRYRVEYDTFADTVVLQLEESDGSYLIAGEPV